MDRDALVPKRHPRYEEKIIEAKPKKNSSRVRSKESRDLWRKFYDQFKEVHGYQYTGDFMKDTGNIEKFLKKPGINFDVISTMIDYIFQEKRGYWHSDIATINTLCYNQSSISILDVVKRRQKDSMEDPNWKSKFGRL